MSNERVLIVDDDHDILALLGRRLEKAGFKVLVADNAKRAIKGFVEQMPDAIVLDLFLPDHHGSELLKDFKHINPEVPVIIVTADSRVPTAVEMIKAGAYDYLVKPDYGHIAEVVAAAIEIERKKQLFADRTERIEAVPEPMPAHPTVAPEPDVTAVPEPASAETIAPPLASGEDVLSAHRSFTRIPFRTNVLINGKVSATSVDISEGGMYLITGPTFAKGTELELEFMVMRRQLRIKARVLHLEKSLGCGCEFTDLSGEQTKVIRYLIDGAKASPDKEKLRKRWIVFFSSTMDSLKMYKSQLLLDGYSILEADSPRALFENIIKYDVSAVIVDLDVSNTDAFAVIFTIKEIPELAGKPVLAFSTSVQQSLIDEAMSSGANTFISRMNTSPKKMSEILTGYLGK